VTAIELIVLIFWVMITQFGMETKTSCLIYSTLLHLQKQFH